MDTASRAARTIAVLLLLQMVGGPVLNFALMGQVVGASGFLDNAAAHGLQAGLAALLGIALAAMSVGIAIAAWPVLRPRSLAMAQWLLVLAAASFVLSAVEAATVLSMRSLSEARAGATAAQGDTFAVVALAVGAARRWAHYANLIAVGAMLCVFYGALLRHALVPRPIGGFGLVAAALLLVAVCMPVFGHAIVFALMSPLGLAHLALVAWLLVKGFAQPAPLA